MNNEVKTLSALFHKIGDIFEEYERNVKVRKAIAVREELYGINDICKIYPKMTKHIITAAINTGELPVTWIGNERCFYLKDIENYLESKTIRKDVTAWRNINGKA